MTSEPDLEGLRFGLDVTKIAHRDGLGTYVRELARALLGQLGPDETLWLYSEHGSPSAEIAKHLGVEAPLISDPRLRIGSSTGPANDDLSLYHATSWSVPAHLGGALLFTVYDLTVLSHPRCHTLDNRIHCLEGLLRARLAGGYFHAISETTALDLEQWFGVPRSEQAVILPAAGPQFTQAGDSEEQSQEAARHVAYRFGITEPPVLAVGTIEPRKNLLRLLDAYIQLPDDLRGRHPLVLAGGEGWHDPESLEQRLSHPKLQGVRRLGRVDDDDLVALYRAAAVFAYPSLAEGFGLPIVEAMACGAPVVTSRGGATEETAGGAAHPVDPFESLSIAQGLAEVLSDAELRQSLIERGHERARAFSWRQSASAMLTLYRRLAATHDPGTSTS